MTNVKVIWFNTPVRAPALYDNPRLDLWVGLGCAAGQVAIGKMTVDERDKVLYIEAVDKDGKPSPFLLNQSSNSVISKACGGGGNVVAIDIPPGSSWYVDAVPERGNKQGK